MLSQLGPWLTLITGFIFSSAGITVLHEPLESMVLDSSPWMEKRKGNRRKKEVIHVTTELTSAACQFLERIWKETKIKDIVVNGCNTGFLQAKLTGCISSIKIAAFPDKGNVVDLIYLVISKELLFLHWKCLCKSEKLVICWETWISMLNLYGR